MIRLNKETKDQLLDLYKRKRISLEGNILKLIETENGDDEFNEYIESSKTNDTESRRKRLDITKKIQSQNNELKAAEKKNETLMTELTTALDSATKAQDEAEKLRDAAVEDLDTLQKRTQFELIGMIVKVALYIIIGVGVVTTILYLIAMVNHYDTKLLETTWSNMFGILLTNSFSIIGTIMGVKYATEKRDEKK